MKRKLFNLYKESIGNEVNEKQEWMNLSSRIFKKNGSRNFFQSFIMLMKYAAVLFIGIGGTWLGMQILPYKNTHAQTAKMCKVATGKGEKSSLELPDGTKIRLNSCSILSYYPSDYGKEKRDIFLEGEAYFEVAKDAEHPFIVRTNGVSVTALGTAFNISAYSEDNQLVTTLFSGKISVQPNLTKQQILLDPNQVAVYYKSKSIIEKKDYDESLYASWLKGNLSFEMMQLQDIAKLLERNYGVAFIFQNKHIKKLQFTGSFNNNETLEDIFQVIKTNINFNYTISNDTVYIQ